MTSQAAGTVWYYHSYKITINSEGIFVAHSGSNSADTSDRLFHAPSLYEMKKLLDQVQTFRTADGLPVFTDIDINANNVHTTTCYGFDFAERPICTPLVSGDIFCRDLEREAEAMRLQAQYNEQYAALVATREAMTKNFDGFVQVTRANYQELYEKAQGASRATKKS